MSPLGFLEVWFIKHQKEIRHNDSQMAFKLVSFCSRVNLMILNQVNNDRDAYLDYFCQFNSFRDICGDLNIIHNNDFFVNIVEEVFQQKFPMSRDKLKKMWNLKPKIAMNW